MITYSLRQLEYFVIAAREGSIIKAAQHLNVSQPSVSAAITKLEEQLNTQLLIRHHAAGVSVTPAGAKILAQASNLLQHAGELQSLAADTAMHVRGTLKLGSFVTLAPLFLPSLMQEFTALHPQTRFEIGEGTQDQLMAGLRRGHYEMALLYDIGLPADMNVATVRTLKPYVLLPHDHELTANRRVSLRQLAGEPMVLLDVAPSRSYFLGMMRNAGVEPNVVFASQSLELVRGLVGRGYGFSILVTRPRGDMSYDGKPLAVRELSDPVEPGRIALATLGHLRLTRLMKAFQDHCTNHFTKLDQGSERAR